MRAQRLAMLPAVLAVLVLPAALVEARAADFYSGKTLTMIVGFAPGGGVDTTARVVARHFVRFIPGAPATLSPRHCRLKHFDWLGIIFIRRSPPPAAA